MASGSRQGQGPTDPEPSAATEPITLTDPDGAVTRVAPWSSWTREQVRAPGGEPALVTRLDQGQLWFSAGRRRSPWRHEVHVGPAIVSTPRGRFQAIAEPDGGATIACLAGRTRVVAGLREPVLLGPDQSAAVSSDGRTLVVMDRASGAEITDPEIIDLTAEEQIDLDAEAELASDTEAEGDGSQVAAAAAGAVAGRSSGGHLPSMPGFDPLPRPGSATPDELPYHDEAGPARLGWIPELVAVIALLALLIAGVWVFSNRSDSTDVASAPTTTAPITGPTQPATTRPVTTRPSTTTAPPSTTAAPSTSVATTRPPAATGATAVGELTGCRRAPGGVLATINVTHRSGPASAFNVSAALIDPSGVEFARGAIKTGVIPPGGSGVAKVLVRATGSVSGSCQVLEVTAA